MTLTLVAEIANSGNISTGQPVTVRFYKGNPGQGGTLIGETAAQRTSEWVWRRDDGPDSVASLEPGVAHVWVEVDPDNVVPEADEQDNLTSATIVIPDAVLSPPSIIRKVALICGGIKATAGCRWRAERHALVFASVFVGGDHGRLRASGRSRPAAQRSCRHHRVAGGRIAGTDLRGSAWRIEWVGHLVAARATR